MTAKKVLINLGMLISMLIIPCCISFGFSSDASVVKEANSKYISELSSKNINSLAYANFSVFNKEEQNETRDYYRGLYKYNFLNATQLLTYCENDGSTNMTFSVSIDGIDLSANSVAVDMMNYSTLQSTVRFETACINVYKYRERHKETDYKNCDGFVYIPDYFADTVISKSNGKYSSYDDLIKDEEETFLSANTGGVEKKYKIGNIFHVEGFNELYSNGYKPTINDYNNGLKMKSFLGDYFVLFDLEFVRENCFSINLMISSKQFSIMEYLSLLSSNKSSKVRGSFYSVTDDSIQKIDSSKLLASINGESKYPIYKIIISVFGIVSAIGYLVLHFFNVQRGEDCVLTIINPVLLVVLNVGLQLISKVLKNQNLLFLYFYSTAFSVTSLIVVLAYMIIYLILLWRRFKYGVHK